MSNKNNDNPKNGKDFQKSVELWYRESFNLDFEQEKAIPIGNPPKLHKFDIVSAEQSIVIECKRYTWTDSGNVPSAKMGFVNEAAFYFSFLPEKTEKVIVMMKSTTPKRKETLAEYYFRTNRHLLGRIKLMEFDTEKREMKLVGQNG